MTTMMMTMMVIALMKRFGISISMVWHNYRLGALPVLNQYDQLTMQTTMRMMTTMKRMKGWHKYNHGLA